MIHRLTVGGSVLFAYAALTILAQPAPAWMRVTVLAITSVAVTIQFGVGYALSGLALVFILSGCAKTDCDRYASVAKSPYAKAEMTLACREGSATIVHTR